MRSRGMFAALIVLAAFPAAPTWELGPAPSVTTCTEGGTIAGPTGVLTVKPDLTNTPAPGPRFRFRGILAGGEECTGTMTFHGRVDAGRGRSAVLKQHD